MGDIIRHLAEVSVRQQQLSERLVASQTHIAEELVRLRAETTARTSPLERQASVRQILPKMTDQDDVEAFLYTFEVIATREDWDQTEWAQLLAPLLVGEPQLIYFSLPTDQANDYALLKKEILSCVGLSLVCAAQKVHEWTFEPCVPLRIQATQLAQLVKHWLLPNQATAAEVVERVTVDRLLRSLPRPHRQAVGLTNPTRLAELVEAVELSEASLAKDSGERAVPFTRRGITREQQGVDGTYKPVSLAAPRGAQQDEPMPTETNPPEGRTWMAGCIVHQTVPDGTPEQEVRINGRRVRASLDTGSSVSLVRP